MAIDAYVGLPGHGKSYGVVEHVIIPSLKESRVVMTNIPLAQNELITKFGGLIIQLPLDWYKDPDFASTVPHGAVLVLDEVWRRWPQGLNINKASMEDKELFAEHRHRVDDQSRSMRIVLVTQDLSQIAAWVRALVEQTYRVVKRVNMGLKNHYRLDIYDGPVTGSAPPKTKLIRQISGKYKKDIYQYYQSATQSQSGGVGDESKADNRGNALKSSSLLFVLIFVPVGGFLSWYGLTSYFSPHAKPAAKSELVNPMPPGMEIQPVVVHAPEPAPALVPSSLPPQSQTWKVVGTIQRSKLQGERTLFDGYHDPYDQPAEVMADMAILKALGGGLRYVPLTDCTWYSDRINVFCDVDGERITPWTGQGNVNGTIVPLTTVARAGTVVTERSEGAAVPAVNRSSQSAGVPVTVISDSSRAPRTLPVTQAN